MAPLLKFPFPINSENPYGSACARRINRSRCFVPLWISNENVMREEQLADPPKEIKSKFAKKKALIDKKQ